MSFIPIPKINTTNLFMESKKNIKRSYVTIQYSLRQLLKIPRFSKIEEFFFKLLRALRFLPKSFYFFFNRIARYAQSKESRSHSSKKSQITCKAIFRNCLKGFCVYIKEPLPSG